MDNLMHKEVNSLKMSVAHNIKAKAFETSATGHFYWLVLCHCDNILTMNKLREEGVLLVHGSKGVGPLCQGRCHRAKQFIPQ